MRIDDPDQRRLVRLRSDIGVGGPHQLVPGHALAGLGHARQPQIGAIGQDGGEKSVLVIAGLTGPDVGECGGKTCRTVDLMQQFGDPYARHHCVEPIGQRFRFGRGDGLQRRDVQPLVTHFDTFKLAPLQALREALQPPVEFAAACFQPLVRRGGQVQLRCDRRHRRGGQQVAVESAVVGRPLHPHVPGAKLVAKRSQHRRLIEAPIRLPSFGDEPPPFLSERQWRVRRDLALAGLIEISQQCNRGEDRVVAPGRLELEYLEERRCELPDGGVPIGGADQRVFLRECGEAGYLGACAKQLRPADGFVDDGERVTVGSLGLAERFDRAVEEPHQAADVFRCRDIGPFLGVLAARERVPDQLVHHVERDIGKPDFQLDQKRRHCRAPPVRHGLAHNLEFTELELLRLAFMTARFDP